MSNEKKWYVIYVTDERRISFLPSALAAAASDAAVWEPKETLIQRVQGKGSMKGIVKEVMVEKPLFPKYVFVHIDLDNAGNIENIVKTTCGGEFLRGAGGKRPVSLTDEEVARIQKIANSNIKPKSIVERYALDVGQAVEIVQGPYRGTKCIIKELKRKTVIVEADVFNRFTLVEVSPSDCIVIDENE